MISYTTQLVTCGVCNASSPQQVVVSAVELGNPDLDLRPAEERRQTLRSWVQECPHCRLCATNLARPTPDAAPLVKQRNYRALLNDRAQPILARRFLALAMLADRRGLLVVAAHAALHAAWACDDERNDRAARLCRVRAIDLFLRVEAAGQWEEQPATSAESNPALWNLQLIDLCRRASRLIEARRRCETALRDADANVKVVAAFQIKLIEALDTAAHDVDEAFPWLR